MDFEKSIENYDGLDEFVKEEIKKYILTFVNENDWLEKRLSSSFSRNPWLINYITRDDLRQEFYLNIFKPKTIAGLMKRIDIARFKYTNSVFSNVLIGVLEKTYGRPTYPLDEDLELSANNISSFDEKQDFDELFLEETLERNVVSLLREGMSNKEIMEQLELSRRSFDKIKKEIGKKIRESEDD